MMLSMSDSKSFKKVKNRLKMVPIQYLVLYRDRIVFTEISVRSASCTPSVRRETKHPETSLSVETEKEISISQ